MPNGHPPIAAPLGDVETERLRLRRFAPDDLDPLARVFAKPEVWQFPYGRAFSREETAAFLKTQIAEWESCGFGLWIAIDRKDEQVVGYVGLAVPRFLPDVLPAVEVGWRFAPEVWGRGFATEGARAALREAFETLRLEEVCSLPQTTNPKSYAVCERLGMRYDRDVAIPPRERHGPITARAYWITAAAWPSGAGET